jgi:phage recombination protein Bet
MAQAARERQALMPAPRYTKPAIFAGTEAAWRVLCDLYPSAETPDIVMAVVEYCAAKRLDPFKGPVHIVPMWNSKLRRRVQTVMRGINEIEIVASRTGVWAGMDLPQWGPDHERTFRGTRENDDGSVREVELRLTFPLWCAVTVYRLVAGERRAFTEQLFWEECYAMSGFRSEVPNERWAKAPRQMLHKCCKAAVLRAAFPEEGLGYAAEEMEDQFTKAGGVTIEGNTDHGDAGLTDRDRQAAQYGHKAPSSSSGEDTAGVDPLMEPNGTIWLKNLTALLAAAPNLARVVEIAGHQRVRASLETAPPLIKDRINALLKQAYELFAPKAADEPPPGDDGADWNTSPTDELLAEIEEMDLDALDTLPSSKAWAAKTRNLIPPDHDTINEAIALRRAVLKGGNPT